MKGTKEEDTIFGLSITDTALDVCVRDKYFCIYVYGRKERSQEINLVENSYTYIFVWVCYRYKI